MPVLFFLTMPIAHANLEHKAGQESLPTESELQFHRGCFEAAADRGCGHPSEDKDRFVRCFEDRFAEFTPGCQDMLGKLYSSAE